ncbi:ATP-binding protein [Neobacillus niacini]|uniref:ATP-binding protein n=1 Tax=Neobacillus niacini TaxID=86668 RepID=UPI0023783AAB|nr:ATP-binding protein [Neobacillus niacini]
MNYKVKFISAAELVEELHLYNEEHKLGPLEKRWLKFELIIIDELGYVPFTKIGSELLVLILCRSLRTV